MKKNNTYEEPTFICKFQRPISVSHEDMLNDILVYNEERTLEQTITVDSKTMAELFPNDEYKIYWLCVLDKDKMLNPVVQVEGQDW